MNQLKLRHLYILNDKKAIYTKITPSEQLNSSILTFLIPSREDGQDVVYLESYHENQFVSLEGRTIQFRGKPASVVRLPNRGTQSESSIMCRCLLKKITDMRLLAEETA